MHKLREMPIREKFERAFAMVRAYEEGIPAFLQQRLGEDAVLELRSVWQAGIETLPVSTSYEPRYQAAFGNWLWLLRSSLEFMSEKLELEGQRQFEGLLVDVHARQAGGLAVAVQRLFEEPEKLAEHMLYQMQWITPVELLESSPGRVRARTTNCQVMQRHGMQQVCQQGCQRLHSRLAAAQYRLKMLFHCQDGGCGILLTPLERA